MARDYVQRGLEAALRKVVAEAPVVLLTGPRQAGKTTLLRQVFGTERRYVSLETPDARADAVADPRGFLQSFAPPTILDEVQHAPELLPYIQEQIETAHNQPGQYILASSQDLIRSIRIPEPLADRIATLRLLPLSRREIEGRPEVPLLWERPTGADSPGNDSRPPLPTASLWKEFLRGGYPELATNIWRDAGHWHANHLQTYLERDVRSLRQVGDLTQFQEFLRILAARSAQLCNLTELARDLGVVTNTAKAWLSLLEGTHQVIVLRPHQADISKRLVKTPKVYFTDLGTLCYLVGLKDPDHAAAGPMASAIVETAALLEIIKAFAGRGETPRLHFWRTATGIEVDFLVETPAGLIPIDVKPTATPRPDHAASIHSFQADLGPRALGGYLLHLGDQALSLSPTATALPLATL